jgi:hypothetical protein
MKNFILNVLFFLLGSSVLANVCLSAALKLQYDTNDRLEKDNKRYKRLIDGEPATYR